MSFEFSGASRMQQQLEEIWDIYHVEPGTQSTIVGGATQTGKRTENG